MEHHASICTFYYNIIGKILFHVQSLSGFSLFFLSKYKELQLNNTAKETVYIEHVHNTYCKSHYSKTENYITYLEEHV